MSIVDLDACVQGESESTTHWVRWVSEVLHSSDRISAGQAILTLERNCRFKSLKMKLGRLKRHCDPIGTLRQPWSNMPILIIPRIPSLMRRNRSRERRTAVRKGSSSRAKEAMGITV